MSPVTISPNVAEKAREWFKAGKGFRMWRNLEIASGSAHEVFTPSTGESPSWRYGNPTDLQPSDLLVEHFTVVETFRGRFKAMYFGPWVAKATEEKAERLCSKHGLAEHSWQWRYDEDKPGYVIVDIGRKDTKPFELDGSEVLPEGVL